MSIESIKIGFQNWSKIVETCNLSARKLTIWTFWLKYLTEWIFNLFMRHSMLSDLAGKQVRLGTGSKLIPVWMWSVPVSIESIKISFENGFEMIETYHIPDSKAYHLAQYSIIVQNLNLQQVMITFHDNLYFWLWIGVAHIDWFSLKIDNTVLRNLLKHSAA